MENMNKATGLVLGLSNITQDSMLDTVKRIGKYQFIYDYNAFNPIFNKPLNTGIKKEGGSNANEIYNFNFDGDGTGNLSSIRWEALFPQPVKVNSEPQVGVFSKGNIVNVIRIEGNNAIVQNPNFVEPDTNAPKTGWFVKFINQKEFSIPFEFLSKVNDSNEVTILTGINYGANMKPNSIAITKPISSSDTTPVGVAENPNNGAKPYLVIEEFKLKQYYKHFRTGETHSTEIPIIKGSVVFLPTFPMQDQYDLALQQGKLQELPIVSVVSLVDKQTGKCKTDGALIQNMLADPCRTIKKGEELRGYIANGVFTHTNQGVIKPQLSFGEYKLVQTNSGTIVPLKDNNKNLLMIAGAFLVGYVLLSNGKSE